MVGGPMEPDHRRHRAFTLVELLVVIAVIAILIGVLLTALSGARASGMGLVSLSNMRQIGTGWSIYSMDEDGEIVPGQPGRYAEDRKNLYDVGNGLHYRPRWFALIGAKAGVYAYDVPSEDRDDEHSYRVNNEVFLCPVVPDWYSTRNCPYGYNYQFLGNARFKNDEEADEFVNYPVRVHQIRSTSGTVMFASCMGTAAGKPAVERTPNRNDGSRDPELRAMGGHGYSLDPPRLTDNCDYADPKNPGAEHRSAPDPRYRGKANVAFCDGHCAAMTLDEMGYVVNEDGSVAADGPAASNRLFSGNARDEDPPKVYD